MRPKQWLSATVVACATMLFQTANAQKITVYVGAGEYDRVAAGFVIDNWLSNSSSMLWGVDVAREVRHRNGKAVSVNGIVGGPLTRRSSSVRVSLFGLLGYRDVSGSPKPTSADCTQPDTFGNCDRLSNTPSAVNESGGDGFADKINYGGLLAVRVGRVEMGIRIGRDDSAMLTLGWQF